MLKHEIDEENVFKQLKTQDEKGMYIVYVEKDMYIDVRNVSKCL